MDEMNELDKIIGSIILPVDLPEAAFVLFGKQRRAPDFDLILSKLPNSLREYLDTNGTASSCGPQTYLLPLTDGRFLRMRVENHAIVELSVVEH